MALGIATDHSSSLLLAASIGLHQPAESMALLVAFLKTDLPQSSIIKWLGFFSLIGPLGVSLGILIAREASPIVEAAVVAMTAGTFLYVGATEIINEEFENLQGSEKWVKFSALLAGMSTIFGGM